MAVRKRNKGKFCDYEFWLNGQRYSGTFNGKNGKPLETDKKRARYLEAIERQKILDGNSPNHEREELKDFCTFVDRVFLPFAGEHHAWPRHDVFRCEVLKGHFKGKRFDQITMMAVVGFINKRLSSTTLRKEVLSDGSKVNKGRSPTTVNKEVTLLSSIFRMAIRERIIAANNPCDELPKTVRDKIPARNKRERRLTLEEEQKLFGVGLQGRREHLYIIVEVALNTGMRKGELFRLEPEHINFSSTVKTFEIKGNMWRVRPNWLISTRSKNGKPRMIPMSQRVRQRLELLCSAATCSQFVFTSIRRGKQITDIKNGWASACREAGITNLTFHDLRHEWSSRAAERGVPECIRRDILGHSSNSITDDYTHSSPAKMELAMEVVANTENGSFFDLDKTSTKGQSERTRRHFSRLSNYRSERR